MPRILRIINRLNIGGPTYNVAYLTKYLAPEYETLLVAGTKLDDEESSDFILDKLNITSVQVSEMKRELNLVSDYKAYRELKKIIKEFKPDIVHTHAAKSGTLGRLAAISCNVPVIVHTFHGHVFHSYFNPLKTKFFLWIERYLAKKSTAIIAISEIQKQELCLEHKVCSVDKAVIIPLGFDLDRFNENKEEKRKQFREKYLLADDEIAIGIIGRFAPVKNHDLFLQAFAKAKQNTSKKIKAIIIGDGDGRKKLEDLCTSLKLNFDGNKNADVIFTSWIKEIDIALAGLDIVAMTSLNEGTPVSLIEAQAAGKPIATTNVGGIENVVLPNQTALLSESNNINAFAENLKTLIENEQMRKSFSEKGWNHVKEKFHYMRLVSDMKSLYDSLLKNKR
jgi:glycosyltransferase involved in cell wall biosynthesis